MSVFWEDAAAQCQKCLLSKIWSTLYFPHLMGRKITSTLPRQYVQKHRERGKMLSSPIQIILCCFLAFKIGPCILTARSAYNFSSQNSQLWPMLMCKAQMLLISNIIMKFLVWYNSSFIIFRAFKSSGSKPLNVCYFLQSPLYNFVSFRMELWILLLSAKAILALPRKSLQHPKSAFPKSFNLHP